MKNRVLMASWSLAAIGVVIGGCGNGDRGEQQVAQQAATGPVATAVQAEPIEPAAPATPFTAVASRAADSINGDDMRTWIAELSRDEMGGRGPGSEGDRMARRYIVGELERLGYQPGAADGIWEQRFDLVGINATMPGVWSFEAGDTELDLAAGSEFIAGSGVQSETASIENAELVFVGYGIEAPEYDWNDFKGQDLGGKVLVMLNNDPDWSDDLFEGFRRLYYGRWTYKYESAARQGAAAAIIIHTTPSAGYPWQVVQTSWTGEQFEIPAGDEPRVQVAGWVTEDAARRLISLGGHDLDDLVAKARSSDFVPVPLGVTTSLTLENRLSRVSSANVLGLLPGSDPQLADEVVVYTAHHDHLGTAETGDGDRIYNGARDNASGVATILAIAKAMTELPERPRRSILIAAVGAEEQGLLGAKALAADPPVAPGRIAANINFDAGNIWGATRDITFIGLGKSSLDDVAQTVATHQGRIVTGDQFPDKGYFYRSDQFALARIGVPAMYMKGGTDYIGRPDGWGAEQISAYTAENYHQPSDELNDEWNFDGLVQDARLGFWCGLIIANDDSLPAWNPGDEFEAARKAALAEL